MVSIVFESSYRIQLTWDCRYYIGITHVSIYIFYSLTFTDAKNYLSLKFVEVKNVIAL